MKATIQGECDATPATVKHSSFSHRPIPSLQLMSQVSALGGGLKREIQEMVNIADERGGGGGSSAAHLVPVKIFPKSNQSQIGHLFAPEDDDEELETNKKNDTLPAQTTTLVIGEEGNGAVKFDRFDRTSSLEKKKYNVKPFTQPDMATIISPITGEISSSYQVYLDKQKAIDDERRRNEEEQRLLDEESNSSDDHPLLIKMRKSLNKKGGTGVLGLTRTFKVTQMSLFYLYVLCKSFVTVFFLNFIAIHHITTNIIDNGHGWFQIPINHRIQKSNKVLPGRPLWRGMCYPFWSF
jgi:hypothetical protein